MGKHVVEEGLTEDQISLFAHAIETVSIRDVNDQTLAAAAVSGDQNAAKAVNKAMAQKENALFKFLMDYGDD